MFRRFRRRIPIRRRRFGRRTRVGAKRKSTWYSDYAGNARTLSYSAKKINRKAWKRKLWSDTLASQHWRAVASATGTISTGTTSGQGTLTTDFPLMNLTGSLGFWENGVIPADQNMSVPLFNGDVTLRGGKIFMQVFNPSTTESIGFKVWRVKTIKNPEVTLFPNVITVPTTYDPTCIPDFDRKVGKIWDMKEGTIRALSSMTYEWKCPIQKIDQATYRVSGAPNTFVGGDQFALVILVYNVASNTAINVVNNTGYNVSFSADAA